MSLRRNLLRVVPIAILTVLGESAQAQTPDRPAKEAQPMEVLKSIIKPGAEAVGERSNDFSDTFDECGAIVSTDFSTPGLYRSRMVTFKLQDVMAFEAGGSIYVTQRRDGPPMTQTMASRRPNEDFPRGEKSQITGLSMSIRDSTMRDRALKALKQAISACRET